MPSTQTTFLAIDAGTHAVRAAIFSDGRMGIVESEALSLTTTVEGFVEQDPKEIAEALRAVCRRALKTTSAANVVAAMAVQRSSVLAWDRNTAAPLSAVLSWQDTRGQAQIAALDSALQKAIPHLTGLQPSAHYGASKLAWLQAHLDDNKDFCMGPLASWLVSQLTGSMDFVCDHVNAARTLLLNRAKLTWSAELCAAFTVPTTRLPRPVNSVADYGSCSVLGGSAQVNLAAVLGDQNAAYVAIAHGNITSRAVKVRSPLIVNIGSGGFVLGQAPAGAASEGLLSSLAYSLRNNQHWLQEGTVNGAGTTITRWLQQRRPSISEAEFFQAIQGWMDQASNDGYFCIDRAVGLGSPFWQPRLNLPQDLNGESSVKGVSFFDFSGRNCTPGLQQQAVAVVESIIFLLAVNIFRMRAGAEVLTANGPYDGIIVSGGLSRIVGLVERLSDLVQLPCLMADCHEATLQGVVCLASQFDYRPSVGGRWYLPKALNPSLLQRYQRYIQLLEVGCAGDKR